MENTEVEKICSIEDGGQLTRSRSFKTKQLVRSQAIREAASPPRTASPASYSPDQAKGAKAELSARASGNGNGNGNGNASDASSHASDASSGERRDEDGKRRPVEIQITHGGWESESSLEQRQRTQLWLGNRHHSESSRDLLSNNPRVACVCGACGVCPHCRGRRRKPICPSKQDSGIVCSDECPDCSDSEQTASPKEGSKQSGSVDVDDTFYCRCPERKEKPKNTLSRTDSDDKAEPTGPELVDFIKETLNKNPRDRLTLLKIEKELHNLVNDTGRCIVRFPVMTSYGRMLVHRCAQLFQLTHQLDQTNKTSVMVSKMGTSGGRIPCTSFKDWCTTIFPCSPQHRRDETLAKSILKRSAAAGEEAGGAGPGTVRSKSLEQRERDYERVRRRIFSSDNCAQDESQWPWLSTGPVKLLTSEGRNKLIKVQSLERSGCDVPRARGAVSKSHSFGGYAADAPQQRLLSKQGDLASSSWRLSPSSSGYKTLSLRSTDSVTPSPTGGASPEPGVECGAVVWAVTDLSSVPPGALVIHPQTGRPLTNPDGSVYHFDPANPPVLQDATVYLQNDQFKADANNEKRRGRLEKQHSFMDNECECQPAEDCRTKCCCECRRQETCNKTSNEKAPVQPEQKPDSMPQSPVKARVEPAPAASAAQPAKPAPEPEERPAKKAYEPENRYEAQRNPYEGQRNHYETQRSAYEPAQRTHEASQRPVYESPRYNGSPSHRTPSLEQQRALEQASHRNQELQAHRLANRLCQEGQEVAQYLVQPYMQGYRTEEVTSPPQAIPNPAYVQADMASLHNVMLQAKVTPVPIQDPNMRSMSITNVMYPSPMAQGFPFVNPCRLDAPMQPVYQQMMQQQPDETKQLAASPHNNDTTFRIDPSYPYAAEISAACGGCVGACDPTLQHQHRGYNVSYAPVEVPQYPVSNVLLPQQIPHYPVGQYQETVPWAVPSVAPPKLLVQELYPVVYPNVYPQYNVVYPPQVLQQPYPLCQPVYPVAERPSEAQRRAAAEHRPPQPAGASARGTPERPQRSPEAREPSAGTEIAAKIQQIKEQMAQLNTRERDGDRERERGQRRDEWRRRNSGNGILGNYPAANHFNGRLVARTPNDETQLSSAARAIVNSIRSMQARSTYHPDGRRSYEYPAQYYRHENRHEPQNRHRQRQERGEQENRQAEKPSAPYNARRADNSEGKDGERRPEGPNRNRNFNPVPFQYRPPYLFRQMSPGTWCRRSPGPVHPVLNHPRRPHPDTRNFRR